MVRVAIDIDPKPSLTASFLRLRKKLEGGGSYGRRSCAVGRNGRAVPGGEDRIWHIPRAGRILPDRGARRSAVTCEFRRRV